ncbi:hypothetical protein [Anaerofustis stercorihominis]|uniref:hypothetical protein n=1 Tax=Anaerofustis stercorihominis TaxID=214853 RepID=UPI0039945E1B
MAIALRKDFVTNLDELYRQESLTDDLSTSPELIKAGTQANEILIPKMSTSGLGDYDKATGYPNGTVNLEYETKKFNYDRGMKFQVDYIDNEETANIAFGKLLSNFTKEKIVPEGDAFTFAKLASAAGIQKISAGASLADGADVISALSTATDALDNEEVSDSGRILYILPALDTAVKNLDTTKSREILGRFEKIVRVPQPRFYTAIDLLNTSDFGYSKASSASSINFLIAQKDAVMKHDKHVASDIIEPRENQTHDAYALKYRKYGIVEVLDNKSKGIYLHFQANA